MELKDPFLSEKKPYTTISIDTEKIFDKTSIPEKNSQQIRNRNEYTEPDKEQI